MACGGALARSCPACGSPATAEARFCSACGCALASDGQSAGRATVPTEERRRVSVLFADIVGYTTVAERLDHESVKALTARYLSRLALEVERFGGYVDQYIGDNVMAVFGAPIAHEDDAERAVRSAWGMQQAMAELNRAAMEDFGLELALRVGVNTGDVLAGRIGEEYTVVGDAVNVAARLQGAAPVGGIVVGELTSRSTGEAVVYRPLGPLKVKGRAEPVSAWQVEQVNQPTGLREGPGARTPMVGRQVELAQLVKVSDRVAREGLPRLVMVLGEAGIGKTRLVGELELRLKRRVPPTYFLRGRSVGFGSESAYGPLAEMLRGECAIGPDDDGPEIERKLHERLAPLLEEPTGSAHAEQRLAAFVRLLGAQPTGARESVDESDQLGARDLFFGVVRALFEELSDGRLPVIVWEDTQWADEGTLELIDYLAEWTQTPLLQICIARGESLTGRAEWSMARPRTSSLMLEALSRDESLELIEALGEAGERPVGDAPAILAERSGGNPLFAEALFDSLSGEEPGVDELPGTVRGLLASRLDALEPFARQLLGHAAVVGLSFSRDALEPLAADGEDLAVSLGELSRRNLIAPAESAAGDGEAEFVFRHMLIREVAYEMLPKAVRARKHAEVGRALERRGGELADAHAGALAEHFTRAATLAAEVHLPAPELGRMRSAALEHCIRAGDVAASLFSNREALARYRAAGEFAAAEDPIRFQLAERSGEVQSRLGRVGEAIDAWQGCIEHYRSAGEVERVAGMHRKIAAALVHNGERDAAVKQLQRGINMIKDGPPSVALVRLFGEAATLYMQVGANMLAAYASERALSVAQQLGEPRVASRAYGINGRVFGRIGDVARARKSLERAVELVRELDPEETVLALLSAGRNMETCEGDYEGAELHYREALGLAERIGELPGQIELHAAIAQLALHRCEWDVAIGAASQVTGLAEREGLVSKLCLADAVNGRLRWCEGDWEESARLLRRAHAAAARLGWSEVSAGALMSLASTLSDGGDQDAAEVVLREAGAVCESAALTPLAIEICSAMTRLNSAAGRPEIARQEAERASKLARQVHDPISQAAALEARGIVEELDSGLVALRDARAGWQRVDRKLDAARCLSLSGERTRERSVDEAQAINKTAALAFEELRVTHLAAGSWELAEG
jgi:adenylate cyclase